MKKILLILFSIIVFVSSFFGCNKNSMDVSEVQPEILSTDEVIKHASSDATSKINSAENSVSSVADSKSEDTPSKAQSEVSQAESQDEEIDPREKTTAKETEVLNAFSAYYDSFNLTYNMTDEQIAELSKTIKTSDGVSIYDKGVNLRFDNYNGKGIRYGLNGNYIGHSQYYHQVYYRTKSDIDSKYAQCSVIRITDSNADMEYPLGIKPGVKPSDVIASLGMNNEYEYMRTHYVQGDEGYIFGDEKEGLTCFFYASMEESSFPAEWNWLSFNYQRVRVNENGDEIKEQVTLYFCGVLKYIAISNTCESKAQDITDSEKMVKFSYENAEYKYSINKGVYMKVNEISVCSGVMTIKYSAYSAATVSTNLECNHGVTDCRIPLKRDVVSLDSTEKEYQMSCEYKGSWTVIHFGLGGVYLDIDYSPSFMSIYLY